ncbi:MAG: F0F1 ATP synthase subunit B [Planctomycetes bacterium]|nr:F0F1 ATP synthase subunit B [Planctomycetota bacterium]
MRKRWWVVLTCSLLGLGPAIALGQGNELEAPAEADGHADQASHGESDADAGGNDEHGEAEKPALLQFDPGAAIWSIIIFLVLLGVLRAFAWKPILTALQDREEFIRDSLRQAKTDRESAEARLEEYEQRLQSAREEASAIVEEGRRDAEVVKRELEATARQEAGAMIERAKREIGIARDTAVKELYDLSGELATNIASRIIRQEVDPAAHERLIAESIDELAKLGGNGKKA